ncbi:TetR/AcrR family transcriptional regulator [Sphingomonas prati]|uniref:AcrR family transcriptional regulator n=1 Tax=Sphingomonas prati TaxID=1843237 RepID=A0A7W9BU35_9SPHN|nr:TetR/AcrR family transcriptional regulator [Sphingomonas prati]MBB5730140.1 AcrR family transcriptional regulator [Sphingomonas prati]GGE91804.1 transcriptional regulator [Sphingomonas prati]
MADKSVLRLDARQNRERILAAAEQAFRERGAGVPLEDVAKRAGVGIGTLYRRFPTREALLAETSNARFLALAEASRARDATLSPEQAIRAFLEELVLNTSIYQSLAASLGTVLQCGTPGCNAIKEEGQRLLGRGQDVAAIRHDITFDDLICVVIAISLAVEQDVSSRTRVVHLVDLLFGGITSR